VFVWEGGIALSGTQVLRNEANFGGGVCVFYGSAALSGTQVASNSASTNGGGVYVYSGNMTLGRTRITANVARDGSALHSGGTISPTTALTITGEVYQRAGRFAGSDHDLRIEGSLSLAGGDLYAPDTPHDFVLSGPFTHTGGTYHQTQLVNGSGDVVFPGAGGLVLNANGLDLGSTEVSVTAGAECAGVPAGETVRHCYVISPTNTGGRDAVVTFDYRGSERFPGHACAAMEAYRWTGTWGTPLTRDPGYGGDGRLCGPDPQSLRVTGVSTFSPFVLRGPAADVRISKVVTPAVASPGEAITYTLTYSNAGLITATGIVITDTVPVSITNTSVSSSGAAITPRGGTRYAWDATDLAPGTGGVITISGLLGDPLAASVFTNTVAITTTAMDSDAGNNRDDVEITVLAPEITVRPLSLSFGDQDVDAGPTISQTVTITNDGTAGLNIASVSLTGDDVIDFAFVSELGENPLPPGGAWVVRVTFDPASAGQKSALLTIESNDSDEPTVHVTLSGTSVALHYSFLPLVLRN
jgi:uncharacterized repeat protein (TIGR01451 family)